MTGEKEEWDANTLCIPYISLHDPPYTHTQFMQGGPGGLIYREYTEC